MPKRKTPVKRPYEAGTPTGVMRARQSDLDVIDEIARRLGCRPRDAVSLAVGLLRAEMGMERESAVDSVDALARQYGDDAVIMAELELPTRAQLTIDGQPLEGYIGYAMCGIVAGEVVTPAGIGMIDEATRDHFDLGVVEDPENGATVEVRVGDLLERWKPPRTLSAENVDRVRADFKLREALRQQVQQQRGEHEDDE